MRIARTPVAAVIAVLLLAAAAGCGVGDPGAPTSETRTVDGATAVDLRSSGTVTVTIGDEPELVITAGENVIDRLTSDVVDGVLVLGTSGPGFGTLGPVTYDLTIPTLEAVTVSGSGDVTVGRVATGSLALDISGSGEITAETIAAESIDAVISGSGTIGLAGKSARQDVEISGSGRHEAADLVSADVDVLVSGSGSADVTATDSLTVTVSGSGSVTYGGDPSVTSRISGSGSVTPR
jgi:Putative auto-transporter adhesin, head GIN domain